MFKETNFDDYEPKNKKVMMIGKGHGWWLAPKDSHGYDVWGINDLIMQRTDINLLFDTHIVEDYSAVDMHCTEFANQMGIPIIMTDKYDHLPASIAFPLEEAKKRFETDYFTTGIAFMFAYAIMKGYEEIDCWGINMRGSDEKYKNARACVEFWIGYAMGKGIKVNMLGKYCDCLKAFDRRIYGFNELQTLPHDINDRALYVTFGSGLDREALDKFHELLSLQKDSKYHNNLRPLPISDPYNNMLFGNLEEIVVKQGDGVKYVGDVGFYNLLHIDLLINSEHSSKTVIFENEDKEKTINDWLEFSGENNFWTDPKGESWNGDKQSQYDLYFPKYDLPKKEALERFYDEYYMMAARSQYKFPGYIKYVNSNMLDTIEGQKELLKFVGYKEEDIILKKEEICQSVSLVK